MTWWKILWVLFSFDFYTYDEKHEQLLDIPQSTFFKALVSVSVRLLMCHYNKN